MRWGLVIALVGCASGGNQGEDVDASVADAQATCGEPGLLPCIAIHVAKSGIDTNNGANDSPMKTITAAIARGALVSPRLPVFIQAGIYEETVSMREGVDLYGGFNAEWERALGSTTVISGGSPAVTIEMITGPIKLDGITVRAADATTSGSSSTAVSIVSSTLVELVAVSVEAGIGADGADGSDGADGAPGGPGGQGVPGVERSNAFGCDFRLTPVGGTAGTSTCARDGGRGGRPGTGDVIPSAGANPGAGFPGVGGSVGTAGGVAATGNTLDGQKGPDGSNGTVATDGAGGSAIGMFASLAYVPAGGGNGTAGGHGNGGGGGGGGGGGVDDCDSTGSSGGGGGGGGCGGELATAGGGGGGSFGVLIFDSTVTIRSSTISASRGGDGGSGGSGGSGGLGGAGGLKSLFGGDSEQNDGGFGGPGGKGGNGARGGHGGGGGGGPSVPVVCSGTTTLMVPQTMLLPGTGGMGGSSPGLPGQVGSATTSIGCSFF